MAAGPALGAPRHPGCSHRSSARSGKTCHRLYHPSPAWPTLAPQASAERAGLTDVRAPGAGPPPQHTCPAPVRATQQHPRDDVHQLPDHSPCTVGPAGQAVGWEEERLQMVGQLAPISHRAAHVSAAINQLTVLQAGERQGSHLQQAAGSPLLTHRQAEGP